MHDIFLWVRLCSTRLSISSNGGFSELFATVHLRKSRGGSLLRTPSGINRISHLCSNIWWLYYGLSVIINQCNSLSILLLARRICLRVSWQTVLSTLFSGMGDIFIDCSFILWMMRQQTGLKSYTGTINAFSAQDLSKHNWREVKGYRSYSCYLNPQQTMRDFLSAIPVPAFLKSLWIPFLLNPVWSRNRERRTTIFSFPAGKL